MAWFFQTVLLFFFYHLTHCIQPYFPTQIVFTVNGNQTLYAIDQINQRAYVSINGDSPQTGYVFQHFPYAPADTPQSKYYVQLVTGPSSNSCAYGTYWKYGGNSNNLFPAHWVNATSFDIKNYLDVNYQMIHSTNHSQDEDYWYSQEVCYDDFENTYPCFRIYFKKNTDVPLRSIAIRIVSHRPMFQTTNYQVLSIGKPDDKYFANISKNWYSSCLDVNLRVTYYCDAFAVYYHDYRTVGVSLSTPPHRVNGNDTVIIRWNVTNGCDYCLRLTPKQLAFNSQNFNQVQNLTFYRAIDSVETTFTPSFIGGGFDLVSPGFNTITFQAG